MATDANTATLGDKEKAWLTEFVGDPATTANGPAPGSMVVAQGEWEASEKRKADLLKSMREKLAARKDLIRQKMTFELKLKNAKVNKPMDVARDPNKQFDIGRHCKQLGATEEDKAAIDKVIKQVNEGLDLVAELVDEVKNVPKAANAKDKPPPRSEVTKKGAVKD